MSNGYSDYDDMEDRELEYERSDASGGSRGLSSVVRVALFFLAGMLLTLATGFGLYLSVRGVERTAPTVFITEDFKALTSKGSAIDVVVEDRDTGLQGVIVVVRQGAETIELESKPLERAHQFASTFSINPSKLKLKDGPAELIVQAWDDSVWGNRIVVVRPFVVDTEKPRVELVWSSPSIEESGTGVAVYKALDHNLSENGVRSEDGKFFAGVAASSIDPDFTDPHLYISFFTASPSDSGRLAVVASDLGDNSVVTDLGTTVRRRQSQREHRFVFGREAIQETARNLLSGSVLDLKHPEQARQEALIKAAERGERTADVAIVKTLVEEAREGYLGKIRDILRAGPREPKRWARPGLSAGIPRQILFGDRITLADSGGDFITWFSEGEEAEFYVGGESVVAPFSGVVRFAQNLGVYGNSIVIDHGAGLCSFFYSLGATHVDWGARVELGQRIGQIGTTGFNFSRRTRYMLLVHGYPVDPRDWMESQRYTETIEGPLSGAKQRLGVPVPKKTGVEL